MYKLYKFYKNYILGGFRGFTLIELLVVVAVIGILAALMVTNLAGARDRAADARKKAGLHALKTALQLYQNNYHQFPATGNGLNLLACGASGTSLCTSSFTAGGIEYMKKLPQNSSGQNEFRYYACDNRDDFRLKINLSNASDPEILESQAHCPSNGCTSYGSTDYVVCAN